jgi:hypothetical protein
MKMIRNIAKTFFPAFCFGTGFCFTQMLISDRPILSAGLILVCIGMVLACANLEVWVNAKMKGESKNGRSNQSDCKAA